MQEQRNEHDCLAELLICAGSDAAHGRLAEGEKQILIGWPHKKAERTRRSISDRQKIEVFLSDGFRCRYSGDRLFFGGYLTALSALWPEAFPAHPHGKSDEAHDAYWSHFASVEHVDPVSIGGKESKDNWITTSMARNQVRSRYSLHALGWSIRARERSDDWDGGTSLFIQLIQAHPGLLDDARWGQYLRRWHKIVPTQEALAAILVRAGKGEL